MYCVRIADHSLEQFSSKKRLHSALIQTDKNYLCPLYNLQIINELILKERKKDREMDREKKIQRKVSS